MTTTEKTSFEDRIQKPAYLLFLVVVLLFLIIGFVNLVDHTSRNPVVLGRYSWGSFIFMVVYTIGMLGWASLLLRPNDDRWLRRILDFIQMRPPIAIGIFVIYGIIIWQFFAVPRRWVAFPALQVLLVILMFLSGGILLFYRWGDDTRPQLWRKVIAYALAFLLVLEIIMQALSYFGALPSLTRLTDSFSPYSRIYYNNEGFQNTTANNWGWHYPPFELSDDSYRIILLGDSFLQAFQVDKEENLGVRLEEMLNQELPEGQTIEVLGLGHPDYGPGVYMDQIILEFALEAFNPDEAIIFFDIGNDFQSSQSPEEAIAHFIIDEEGGVVLHPDNWLPHHELGHEILRGYEPTQLVELVKTHYLTPRVVMELIGPSSAAASGASEPFNWFLYNEQTDDLAQTIAGGQLKTGINQLKAFGVDVRMVTIPAFPVEFYEADTWQSEVSDGDLLHPENELRRFAEEQGIPFFGLGHYLASQEAAPDQVQDFYFNDGQGHYTAEGHAFAAEAVYNCFFSQSLSEGEGCDNP